MNQDNQKFVYVAVKPDQMHLINHQKPEFSPTMPRDQELYVTHELADINKNTAPSLFVMAIINMGFQLLQIKFLASQLVEPKSNLEKEVSTLIFTGFIIKLAFSLITILASAFYDHKSYFSTFRIISIVLYVASLVVVILTLFFSYGWLSKYTGLDYIYMWYLIFLSLGEFILFIPFGIVLFSSN